jgi:hypothetical protein
MPLSVPCSSLVGGARSWVLAVLEDYHFGIDDCIGDRDES